MAPSRFTRSFEDTAAWLTARTDKTTVKTLMRIDWCTVGRIVERVVDEVCGRTDWLSGLRRIGIDEIAYRKRHKYLVVVLDHDTGRLVWAAEGRKSATVEAFFDELGTKRAAKLELVTADAANWIGNPVRATPEPTRKLRDMAKKIPDVFSTHSAAKFCRVTPMTIIRWIDEGRIKAYKTPGGHRRIMRADLEDFCRTLEGALVRARRDCEGHQESFPVRVLGPVAPSIDRICRWAFPLAYVLLAGTLGFVFLNLY